MKYNVLDIKKKYQYCPITGDIRRASLPRSEFKTLKGYNTHKSRFAGKLCGSLSKTNSGRRYLQIRDRTGRLLAHRVAWVLYYGFVPDIIDHVDGNGLNNKIQNLRNVTTSENAMNQRLSVANTTGVTGVYRTKSKKNPYKAQIKIKGKSVSLGFFKTIEDASKARNAANIKYGFHSNHGAARTKEIKAT